MIMITLLQDVFCAEHAKTVENICESEYFIPFPYPVYQIRSQGNKSRGLVDSDNSIQEIFFVLKKG
jgi:hypothetical protein